MATAEKKILEHMNSDHPDSLAHYLQHYHKVPASEAQHARLTRMTLSTLYIRTDGPDGKRKTDPDITYLVSIDPPLKVWKDARPRLVEMDNTALSSLGGASITVTDYPAPRFVDTLEVINTMFLLVLFHSRDALQPDGLFGAGATRFPSAFGFLRTIQPWAFWGIIALHAVMVLGFERRCLAKHGMSRFSGAWWAWMVDDFLGPVVAKKRFERLVQSRLADKTAKQH